MRKRESLRIALLLLAGVWCSLSMTAYAVREEYTEGQLRQLGVQFLQADVAPLTCSTTGEGTGSVIAPSSKIFYLGDSLMQGMVTQGGLLDKSLAAGFTIDTAPTIVSGETPLTGYNIGGAYGGSVSATGGITIDGTTQLAITKSQAEITQAGAIIIGLGTNAKAEAKAALESARDKSLTDITDEEVATAQSAKIPLLISSIRSLNATAPIYWINTYTSNLNYANYETVNRTLSQAGEGNYKIIDIAAATAANTIPEPDGGDGVHYSPASYGARAQWLADQLITYTSEGSNNGTYDPLTLTYPNFPDEDGIAASIQRYIEEKTPRSPWLSIPNIGQWIVTESKNRGINPMLVVGLGKQENQFGTVGNNARVNNNYFGIKGDNGYVHFLTPILGMTGFLDALKRNIIDRSHSSYKEVSSFYEYVSVHQTGGIHYPGDGMNIYDPQMDVYVSWDTEYNPKNYWATVTGVVSAITGLSISPEIPARGSSGAGASLCGSNTENAVPGVGVSEYVVDCSVNDGNAAIACTAVNQLQNIPYDADKRAAPTDPNPQFLDCSALVTMAIYRTFGVDLGEMCSTQFLTNENFKEISLAEILPGDMIGWGTRCGPSAHISIVASYDAVTDDVVIMQASSPSKPSGIRKGKLASMDYVWAVRYVGQKTLQGGAL